MTENVWFVHLVRITIPICESKILLATLGAHKLITNPTSYLGGENCASEIVCCSLNIALTTKAEGNCGLAYAQSWLNTKVSEPIHVHVE